MQRETDTPNSQKPDQHTHTHTHTHTTKTLVSNEAHHHQVGPTFQVTIYNSTYTTLPWQPPL